MYFLLSSITSCISFYFQLPCVFLLFSITSCICVYFKLPHVFLFIFNYLMHFLLFSMTHLSPVSSVCVCLFICLSISLSVHMLFCLSAVLFLRQSVILAGL